MTSSVSGKRATAAPIARCFTSRSEAFGGVEVATGFEPVWTALQAAASPLGHATQLVHRAWDPLGLPHPSNFTRADDEIRTRDPNLGKVMRYHCATSAFARISACGRDTTRFFSRSPNRVTQSREFTGCAACQPRRGEFSASKRRVRSTPPRPLVSITAPGRLAQLVARFLHTEEVIGSSPVSPTERAPQNTAGLFVVAVGWRDGGRQAEGFLLGPERVSSTMP